MSIFSLFNLSAFIDIIRCVGSATPLLGRAFRNDMVIPEFNKFAGRIEEIYKRCKSTKNGKVVYKFCYEEIICPPPVKKSDGTIMPLYNYMIVACRLHSYFGTCESKSLGGVCLHC